MGDQSQVHAPVAAVRLDDLFGGAEGPMLLKVDVEGEELAVLRGAIGLLERRRIHAVLIEVHCPLLRERTIDPWEPLQLLADYGFDIRLQWLAGFGLVNRTRFNTAQRLMRRARETLNFQVIATL